MDTAVEGAAEDDVDASCVGLAVALTVAGEADDASEEGEEDEASPPLPPQPTSARAPTASRDRGRRCGA
ncbi:hypothetical protein [Micrococcus luteus]|uniref:hypothetical protein n=1 Tax=Micrococcus luteus TaxID=1270 RepID=UPI00055C635E|nr:hypothetical protein [Micrococcus luteus]